jgi:hypothetical protein
LIASDFRQPPIERDDINRWTDSNGRLLAHGTTTCLIFES